MIHQVSVDHLVEVEADSPEAAILKVIKLYNHNRLDFGDKKPIIGDYCEEVED